MNNLDERHSSTYVTNDLPTISPAASARIANEELFVDWQQGRDPRAREELVRRFLPLARKLARRYSGAREPFEDLLQVASLGPGQGDRPLRPRARDGVLLVRGAHDPGRAQALLPGSRLGGPRPARRPGAGGQGRGGPADAELTTGHSPTVQELAEYLELSIEEVLEALETSRAHHASSLDAPYDDGEGEAGTVVDRFGAEDRRPAAGRRAGDGRRRRAPAARRASARC